MIRSIGEVRALSIDEILSIHEILLIDEIEEKMAGDLRWDFNECQALRYAPVDAKEEDKRVALAVLFVNRAATLHVIFLLPSSSVSFKFSVIDQCHLSCVSRPADPNSAYWTSGQFFFF